MSGGAAGKGPFSGALSNLRAKSAPSVAVAKPAAPVGGQIVSAAPAIRGGNAPLRSVQLIGNMPGATPTQPLPSPQAMPFQQRLAAFQKAVPQAPPTQIAELQAQLKALQDQQAAYSQQMSQNSWQGENQYWG